MTTNLKPCPFCGDEAIVYSTRANGNDLWNVECGDSGCPIWPRYRNKMMTKGETIKAWNTRTSSPPSAWQPIETAPRDGARILVKGGGLTNIARWCYDFWEYDGYDGSFTINPTHWMPLPDEHCTTESVATVGGGSNVKAEGESRQYQGLDKPAPDQHTRTFTQEDVERVADVIADNVQFFNGIHGVHRAAKASLEALGKVEA